MNKYLLAFGLACMLIVGACKPPGPVIGAVTVDCLGDNRPSIDSLLAELLPIVTVGKVDWSAVYARAKRAGSAVGGCVLAELVQLYLGGSRALPAENTAWEAHQALEAFRDAEAGGATFQARCARPDASYAVCKL